MQKYLSGNESVHKVDYLEDQSDFYNSYFIYCNPKTKKSKQTVPKYYGPSVFKLTANSCGPVYHYVTLNWHPERVENLLYLAFF